MSRDLGSSEVVNTIFYVNFIQPPPPGLKKGMQEMDEDIEDFRGEAAHDADILLKKAIRDNLVDDSNASAKASYRARLLEDVYRSAKCLSVDAEMRNEKSLKVSGDLHPNILRLALKGFPVPDSAMVRLEAVLKDVVHTISVTNTSSKHLPRFSIICTIYDYDPHMERVRATLRMLVLQVTAEMVTVVKKKKDVKNSTIDFMFSGLEATFNARKYRRDRDGAKVEKGKMISQNFPSHDIEVKGKMISQIGPSHDIEV